MPEEMTDDKQSPMGPGESPVSKNAIVAIAGYLIVVVLLVFLGLYWRWPACDTSPSTTTANANRASNSNVNGNANVSTNANASAETGQNTNSSGDNEQTPKEQTPKEQTPKEQTPKEQTPKGISDQGPSLVKVTSVSPASGPTTGDTWITIKGSGFKAKAKVAVGGLLGTIDDPVTDASITVRTPAHPPGKTDLVVINPDGNSDLLPSAYSFTCPPPSDSDLILIVILAGALGGSIHALRSLFWYVGNRDLLWSWVPMYLLLPFIGAAMAVVFFLIVRGGFMDPPKDKEGTLFIIAIAALTGLFSQQAALKLADIANAVFTKPGAGTDSKPQKSEPPGAGGGTKPATPTVPAINPGKGSVNGNQEVKIAGTGFASVKSVSFGGVPASDVSMDTTTSTISAKTPPRTKGEVEVIVTDNKDQTVKLKYTYE